jgi:DNA polymerase-1
MRVLACACNEQNLIRLFEDPGVADVYRLMASQIYSKSIADVSSHERSVAKTISLGIIYGMGPDQTAARLSITRAAAVQIIQKFHRLFPAISGWVSGVKERARKNGYVQTMGKFRRYLPDMASSDTSKRATAERQSVNTIIQGSASEMIKLAMISMSAAIEGEDWDYESQTLSKPVLVATIHDELLYSVNKKLEPKLVRCLRRVMEDEVPRLFRLPLKFCVTVSSGDDWGTLEDYVAG